jgi:thioredoxin-related protein
MKSANRSALILAVLLFLSGAAGAVEWIENFEDAKAKAQKEGKHLLLDFTGSDWCGWCKKLKHEVFDTEVFRREAPKNFILVELDFPHGKAQADSIRRQNQELSQRFGIEGYPTVILCDANGNFYARTGYRDGGGESYVNYLTEIHDRKARREDLVVRAAKAHGVEKAKLLDEAISNLGKDETFPNYDDTIAEIVAADADNALGLKAKYGLRVELKSIVATAEAGDVDGAIQQLDKMAGESSASAQRKQEILYLKAILLKVKRDERSSITVLKSAREADPQSERGKEIAAILAELGK